MTDWLSKGNGGEKNRKVAGLTERHGSNSVKERKLDKQKTSKSNPASSVWIKPGCFSLKHPIPEAGTSLFLSKLVG